MGVYELLGKTHPLDGKAWGYCIFSGAKTSTRLPSGDYISPELIDTYTKKGWLTQSAEYSDKYFTDNPGLKRFCDPKNHVQAIGGAELFDAIQCQDTDVVSWLLENVTMSVRTLDEAIRVAKKRGSAGTRTLLEQYKQRHYPETA